jgi:hypothetical protein
MPRDVTTAGTGGHMRMQTSHSIDAFTRSRKQRVGGTGMCQSSLLKYPILLVI